MSDESFEELIEFYNKTKQTSQEKKVEASGLQDRANKAVQSLGFRLQALSIQFFHATQVNIECNVSNSTHPEESYEMSIKHGDFKLTITATKAEQQALAKFTFSKPISNTSSVDVSNANLWGHYGSTEDIAKLILKCMIEKDLRLFVDKSNSGV